jgi:hypothetical protein
MSHLQDEIGEQPLVFERLLRESREQIRAVTRAIVERAPKLVIFAARGSSDNAATYAHYLIEMYLGLPVSSSAPSVYGLYHRFPRLVDALVIGISQSGQSPDVVGVLAEAQRQGALTVAITNERSSPLAHAADLLIEQQSGQEQSVAATKTYTTQLIALALLVAEICQDAELLAGIEQLPAAARLALELEDAAERMAEDLGQHPACLVLARRAVSDLGRSGASGKGRLQPFALTRGRARRRSRAAQPDSERDPRPAPGPVPRPAPARRRPGSTARIIEGHPHGMTGSTAASARVLNSICPGQFALKERPPRAPGGNPWAEVRCGRVANTSCGLVLLERLVRAHGGRTDSRQA